MLPRWSHVSADEGPLGVTWLPYLTYPMPGLDWPTEPVAAMAAVLAMLRKRGDARFQIAPPAPAQTRRALESESKDLKAANERVGKANTELERKLEELTKELEEARKAARPSSDDLPTYAHYTQPASCFSAGNRQHFRFKPKKWVFGLNRACNFFLGGLPWCKPYTISDKPKFFWFKPKMPNYGLNHNCTVEAVITALCCAAKPNKAVRTPLTKRSIGLKTGKTTRARRPRSQTPREMEPTTNRMRKHQHHGRPEAQRKSQRQHQRNKRTRVAGNKDTEYGPGLLKYAVNEIKLWFTHIV